MRELIGFILAFFVLMLLFDLWTPKGACLSVDGVQHCFKLGTDK